MVLETLGSRVQLARESKNFSLQFLAGCSGLSGVSLRDIENDKRNPSVSNVLRLSDVLEVSVEWLLRGKVGRAMKCPLCKGKGSLIF